MRSPRLLVFLPFLAAVLLAAGSALAIDPNVSLPLMAGKSSAGLKYPLPIVDGGSSLIISGTVTATGTVAVTGTDGGAARVVPGGPTWDCGRKTRQGTITSTGTTNHGAINSLPAGSYVTGYCTGFAYVGGASVYLYDGGAGNAATCASRDAGTIPSDDCWPYQAYEHFYFDLRNGTENSLGVTSGAAATVNCPVSTCTP